jgi:phenylacetate-CoA ligase
MSHPLVRRLVAPVKRMSLGSALIRGNPLHHTRAARLFAALEAAPLEQRRAWMRDRLGAALRVAGTAVFGRRLGSPGALEAWPLLTPAEVRERPRDFVRTRPWPIPSSTGGTTGVPLPLARSARSVAYEQAAIDHVMRAAGVDPARARIAVVRGDDVKSPSDREPPFWRTTHGGRRLVFSSNHLDRGTVAAYAGALRDFAADVWWVYPTALEALVRLADEAGERLRVPLVLASSEVLSPWVRAAATAAFGCRVADYYGQAERVAFAWSVRPGEYRFLPGYSAVELVPAPDAGEGARYEVVGTVLWNEAMPLVRYRTGDIITLPSAADAAMLESVALGVTPFGGIEGRDGDILVGPDGARLTGIDHFHRGVDRVVRVQVAHLTPGRVEVRVIPAPGFGDAERAQLMANARRKLPGTMEVEVVLVDTLERTPLGKTPFVIRGPGVPGPARRSA